MRFNADGLQKQGRPFLLFFSAESDSPATQGGWGLAIKFGLPLAQKSRWPAGWTGRGRWV